MTAANKGNGRAIAWLRAHVNHADDACLIWPFARTWDGRGNFGHLGKVHRAHRFMCQLAHGDAPADKPQSVHSCGNGHLGCVNPNHLRWGTNSENQRDKRKHGTQYGQVGSRTRLTPEAIADIRANKGVTPIYVLCERYGIKEGCVRYWQRSTHDPAPPGQSPAAIYKRQKRMSQAAL